MALEIERKFLVDTDDKPWKDNSSVSFIKQGYLCDDVKRSVRIRIADAHAFLTIKGESKGMTRNEFEYPIPIADAKQLLAMCLHSIIIKTRYTINIDGQTWEVDEFHQDNEGLIVAEVELASTEQEISLPDWIDVEVTHDTRFYNLALSQCPYKSWNKTKLTV